MTDAGIYVTYDGDTHWLECCPADSDGGELVRPIAAGVTWSELAAAVAEHANQHGCGPTEPAEPLAPAADGATFVVTPDPIRAALREPTPAEAKQFRARWADATGAKLDSGTPDPDVCPWPVGTVLRVPGSSVAVQTGEDEWWVQGWAVGIPWRHFNAWFAHAIELIPATERGQARAELAELRAQQRTTLQTVQRRIHSRWPDPLGRWTGAQADAARSILAVVDAVFSDALASVETNETEGTDA